MKPRVYKFNSEYVQIEATENKDDEEEQIKRATEESLREFHKQSSFEVCQAIDFRYHLDFLAFFPLKAIKNGLLGSPAILSQLEEINSNFLDHLVSNFKF